MHDSAETASGQSRARGPVRSRVEEIGRAALLALALCRVAFRPDTWWRETLAEASRQAVDALPLVAVLAGMGGALIAQQTGYQFQGTLPSWIVGSVVAASVITEMAPLFAGFALVGVIGTRIAAEIASMQATEQVAALDVMGRQPVRYLVAPRVFAGTLVAPILMIFALMAGLLAGWFTAIFVTRANTSDFWFGVRHYTQDFSLIYPLIKGVVFGAVITFSACVAGLQTSGGSAGVGRSVRRAVIWMISSIIITDTGLVPLLRVVSP